MKAKMSLVAIFLSLQIAVLACSLPSVRTPKIELGSGKEVSEDRTIEPFSGIEFHGGGHIQLVHGTEYKLTITGEDNVLRYISSEVEDNVLVIDYEEQVVTTFATRDVVFLITYVDISKLIVNGGAIIECADLGVQNLQIRINGGGAVTLKTSGMDTLDVRLDGGSHFVITGEALAQTVVLNGGGNYDASDLRTVTTSIELNGAGNAEVWATEALTAKLVGVGRIAYWGSPTIVEDLTGVGTIEKMGDK